MLSASCAVLAQTQAPRAFEVVSVRPSGSQSATVAAIREDSDRIEYSHVTLLFLVMRAYEAHARQIVGLAKDPGAGRDLAIDDWCRSVWTALAGNRETVMALLREYQII